MANLVIKTEGMKAQVIQLKLGTNRLGRSPDNDFQIVHPTVSNFHCEIVLSDGAVLVRDKDSTNGTFVNSDAVTEARLEAGQTLRVGDVELLVESTEISVAIPKFDRPELPAPPVVKDGSMMCPRHGHARVTHQCQKCHEVMCEECVHRLRRRGGKIIKLCPICSGSVDLIGAKPKKRKKRSLLGMLEKTVKMTFALDKDSEEEEE
jgi:uncharacterized Zn finger protein (UPF0148 family)